VVEEPASVAVVSAGRSSGREEAGSVVMISTFLSRVMSGQRASSAFFRTVISRPRANIDWYRISTDPCVRLWAM
jgi:hypothetical protein